MHTEELDNYVFEITKLRNKLESLEEVLREEQGGRTVIEQNYRRLVSELQQQWELKNSLAELEEVITHNQGKLHLKKQQLINDQYDELKIRKQIIEEIRFLEELLNENLRIKTELESRLKEMEERRAKALGWQKSQGKNRKENRESDNVKREMVDTMKGLMETRKIRKEGPSKEAIKSMQLKEKTHVLELSPEMRRSGRKELNQREKSTEKKENKNLPLTTQNTSTKQEERPMRERPETNSKEGSGKSSRSRELNQELSMRRIKSLIDKITITETDGAVLLDQQTDFGNIPLNSSRSRPSGEKGLPTMQEQIVVKKAGDKYPVKKSDKCPKNGMGVSDGHIVLSSSFNLEEEDEGKYKDRETEWEQVQAFATNETNKENMRDDKFQLKLSKARERMREFKRKLGMMKDFLQKFESKALENGSVDIFRVVSELVKEEQNSKYVLNEEENELIHQMKAFCVRFKLRSNSASEQLLALPVKEGKKGYQKSSKGSKDDRSCSQSKSPTSIRRSHDDGTINKKAV